MPKRFDNVVFDVETDGLLPIHNKPPFCMTTIHILVIQDVDTGEIVRFINDGKGRNNIEKGVEILMKAKLIIGHNIVDFDIRAIREIYPYFFPEARIYDTLVMSRMVFANVKEKDFRLFEQGKLPGKLIGAQGLESWGYRLGKNKGDYSAERKAKLKTCHKDNGLSAPTPEEYHNYVWGTYNEEMLDYCQLDVEVNIMLYDRLVEMKWSDEARVLEHRVHELMVWQETNGFEFNSVAAEALTAQLRVVYDDLSIQAIDQIGEWYKPERSHTEPNVEDGESMVRKTWANVTRMKRSSSYHKSNKNLPKGDTRKWRASTVEGAPLTKVKLLEFNPNSRQQVVDRLKTLYDWEPADFTEKGAAKVDDIILNNLAEHIPLAAKLAEIFFYKKRLGLVADGKNGWLKLVRDDGKMHGRVNCGGTITGRATHSAPNISQVPAVKSLSIEGYEAGRKAVTKYENNGILAHAEYSEKKDKWTIFLLGREGDFGWEARALFVVPKGYKLVGSDLSGIEFRLLANLCYPFDGGELIDVILNGDIHSMNADLMGVSRNLAKKLLYTVLYGGGAQKIGSTAKPLAGKAEQITLGNTLKAKLMKAMPALKKAIQATHKEMQQNYGTIRGLDGRRLYIRSKHSALNTNLQSAGALVAKKWLVLIDDALYAAGLDHGEGLDYWFSSWSHDEVQITIKDEHAKLAAKVCIEAAIAAGEYFNIHIPTAAESKIGVHWAETH